MSVFARHVVAGGLAWILLSLQGAAPGAPQATVVVTVVGKDGRAVQDLGVEDFLIREGGSQRKPSSVTPSAATSKTVALLLDISGNRLFQMSGAERDAAIALLHGTVGTQDLGLVAAFSETGEILADLTSDVGKLQRGVLRAVRTKPQGNSSLLDSLFAVCETRLYGPRGLKSLVVVTDAMDTISSRKLGEVASALHRHNIQMYIVQLPAAAVPGIFAGSKGPGSKAMRVLAEETGGFAVNVNYAEQFTEAFRRIAEAIKGQYVLQYAPGDTARPGASIKITTTRKGTKVFSRKVR